MTVNFVQIKYYIDSESDMSYLYVLYLNTEHYQKNCIPDEK